MKRILLFVALTICCATTIYAQQNAKAKEIMDKAATTVKQSGGISAVFSGTQNGKIQLKGEKFHLVSSGIESWFDGKTQWSYVEENEEVNISNPDPEDLQNINPYSLLSFYEKGYHYRYGGTKTRKGISGYEIVLTPQIPGNIQVLTLFISKANLPLYLKIESKNQEPQEISIESYQLHQSFTDDYFKFDAKKYPHAEIIDLR
ncbi:MAG: hypothetical protein J6J09_07940 [Phocaeicola sp.]|nr:hypothetical protein [Phocaeicola sp.]